MNHQVESGLSVLRELYQRDHIPANVSRLVIDIPADGPVVFCTQKYGDKNEIYPLLNCLLTVIKKPKMNEEETPKQSPAFSEAWYYVSRLCDPVGRDYAVEIMRAVRDGKSLPAVPVGMTEAQAKGLQGFLAEFGVKS